MRNIKWNRLAVLDYDNNIDYLLEKWSVSEAQVFIDEVNEIIHLLKSGKVEYQSTNYTGVKRCVVRKQKISLHNLLYTLTIKLIRRALTKTAMNKPSRNQLGFLCCNIIAKQGLNLFQNILAYERHPLQALASR